MKNNLLIRILRRKHKRAIPKDASLPGLPTEILLLIIDYLRDIIDKAFLILVSYAILVKLSSSYWTELRDSYFTMRFLQRLQEGTEMELCEPCCRLHPVQKPNWRTRISRRPIQTRCPQDKAGSWLSEVYFDVHSRWEENWYRFKCQDLDMAMKRYNRGRRHGTSPLSLSHLEINTYNPEMTTLVSVEPRICRGKGVAPKFLLKIQNWVLFNTTDPDRETMKNFTFIRVCGHIRLNDVVMGSIYREFIRRHDFNSKDTNASSMFKCRYCELDFQLEIRNYPHGPAVIVSRWLDLGDRSYEQRWNLCTTEHQKTLMNLGVVFEFGRIRKMFLATDGPSSEFIAMKYEEHLFNNRFKECMRHWTPHTWILRGEEVLWLWE